MGDLKESDSHEFQTPDPERIRISALHNADTNYKRVLNSWNHADASFETKESARLERLNQISLTVREYHSKMLPNTILEMNTEGTEFTIVLPIIEPLQRNFTYSITQKVKSISEVDPELVEMLKPNKTEPDLFTK